MCEPKLASPRGHRRRADARARRAAPRRASPGRASPQIYPPIRREPAGDDIITGWMVRAGRGAHSVLKATFMALEAGDVSLAGVVLEAHEVWPVECSLYADATANGHR